MLDGEGQNDDDRQNENDRFLFSFNESSLPEQRCATLGRVPQNASESSIFRNVVMTSFVAGCFSVKIQTEIKNAE